MVRGCFVLALALAACKGHGRRAPQAAPAQPAAAPRTAAAAHRTASVASTPAAPPRLPAPGRDAGAMTVARAFDAEPTDRTWSPATAQRITRRLPGAQVECHQTLCRVDVTGSEAELTRAVDALNGLSDIARSVVLGRRDEGGKTIVRGYVRFDRPRLQRE